MLLKIDDEIINNVLPKNHKRIISVKSRLLEKELIELEELLLNINKHLTKIISKSLNNDQKNEILNLIKKIKIQNEEIFKTFNLKVEKFNDKQIINTKISYLITILRDSTSKGLKGYGNLEEQPSRNLDNFLEEMINGFSKIESILSK